MQVIATDAGNKTRLALSGHLDTASANDLRDLLINQSARGRDLDVDLTGATSVGTAAVACFVEAHMVLREAGQALTVRANPTARHLFHLLYADRLFAVS